MDDDMDIEAMLDAPLEKKKQENSVSEDVKVPYCQPCNVARAPPNSSLA